jgi:hypothetical protein
VEANGVKRTARVLGILVALMTLATPAALYLDTRYAKAQDMTDARRDLCELKIGQAEAVRSQVRQHQFDVDTHAGARPLTAIEAQRRQELYEEMQGISERLRLLRELKTKGDGRC